MHFAFVALHYRASNGVLRSSFEFLIGFRTLFEFRLRTGRYYTQSNLRTSLPCTTSLVVAGSKPYRTISAVRFVKSFRSDAGGLASLVRRSGFVAIGFRTSDGTLLHTIKAVPNDQCGSVRKVLSVRRRRPRFARPPGAFCPTPADSLRSSADRGSSRSAFDSDGTLLHTI